jgi:hypothetical protein
MYKVAILMEGGSGDKAASAEEEAITTPVFLHCLSPFQKILLQICFNDAIISCIIYYISSSFFFLLFFEWLLHFFLFFFEWLLHFFLALLFSINVLRI